MSPQRVTRRAARVILVSTAGKVLMFRGGDPRRPRAGTWWFTPGGGLEDGESPEQAARRELAEETGFNYDGDLGPVQLQRCIEFEFDGRIYLQTEDYFIVRTEPFELDSSRWSPLEVATVVEHRWWALEELEATHDQIYPEGLVDLVRASIAPHDP